MLPKKPIILGIIVEFNPFHHGHAYFIKQCKSIIKPDLIIAITTTSFTMRGEVAIINKFQKVKLMLASKIDLVLELPFIMGTQSADYFAYHCIKILNQFNITHLAFGIEDGDLGKLYELHEIIKTPIFNEMLKSELLKRTSYKRAYNQVLKDLKVNELFIKLYNQPNATLALQYLISLEQINNKIELVPIRRVGSGYHEIDIKTNFASAKAIRKRHRNNQNINELLPFSLNEYQFINQIEVEKNLLSLIKYQLLINKDNVNLFGFTEGIENYLMKKINIADNYEQLIQQLKNKRYSISRFERLFTYLLLNIPKDVDLDTMYLRVLGFNEKGKSYLKFLPTDIKKKLITSFKKVDNEIAKIELKATKLYSIITNQSLLYLKEYQIPIKERTLNHEKVTRTP